MSRGTAKVHVPGINGLPVKGTETQVSGIRALTHHQFNAVIAEDNGGPRPARAGTPGRRGVCSSSATTTRGGVLSLASARPGQ
jgi:hypothetical protein